MSDAAALETHRTRVFAGKGNSMTQNTSKIRLLKSQKLTLLMAADGYNYVDAAHALRLAPATVLSNRKRLIKRLSARNMTHAVAKALRDGLIE